MQFASHTFIVAARNYSPTERETLVILFILRTFAHIMLREHIILQTDHRWWAFFEAGSEHNHKLTRWWVYM